MKQTFTFTLELEVDSEATLYEKEIAEEVRYLLEGSGEAACVVRQDEEVDVYYSIDSVTCK